MLFDSALQRDRLGRYSFLTANPITTFEIQRATFASNPFAAVQKTVAQLSDHFQFSRLPDLPPFQGGVAGMLSYELGGSWERIPRIRTDEFELPDAWFGIYDWVVAWDHQQNRAWVIAHGLPKIDLQDSDTEGLSVRDAAPGERFDRATTRIREVTVTLNSVSGRSNGVVSSVVRSVERFPEADLAPQHCLPGWEGVTSDFSRDRYLTAVERVIEYIHAGDIFQANLSQRLLARCDLPPVDLYSSLRSCNAAPFAGFLAHDDWAIVSASPERFLRVENGVVETRPIKGTRKRRTGPEADLFTRDELRQSEKDVAENVMIVDLLRNDLSRVCEPGSISVPELCVVETYETVQHLVSEIRGTLQHGENSDEKSSDIWALLAASFPGGSITGAPKVRAMEIISELEPTVRGPYCGSLFYSGFDGTFDSSILIRSFVCRRGWVQCRVGGGIVAQSDPVAEYEETLHKAEGMLRALQRSGLCQPLAK
ncbi:MAG: anthranilate synthase component I family protein [Rhodopirellula sp.]|nr:anthranilate synthase component I family protein [Rhodopirellula sp.]